MGRVVCLCWFAVEVGLFGPSMGEFVRVKKSFGKLGNSWTGSTKVG